MSTSHESIPPGRTARRPPIRHETRLYAHGHHMLPAALAMAVAVCVAVTAETMILPLPWLTDGNTMNLGVPCAFTIAAATLALFRNELSRLEPATWRRADALLLALPWALTWTLAATGLTTTHFAYNTTVIITLGLAAGRWMRTDSIALSLIALLLAQSALSRTFDTPVSYLIFLVNEPTVSPAVSTVAFIGSVAMVGGFKGAH